MKEIKAELKRLANEFAPSLCELGNAVSDKRFERGAAVTSATSDSTDPFGQIRGLAVRRGTVIADLPDSGEVAAIIKGGAAKMNPVLFVSLVNGREIRMGAYAKEGLIHQHSAQKLLDEFAMALE